MVAVAGGGALSGGKGAASTSVADARVGGAGGAASAFSVVEVGFLGADLVARLGAGVGRVGGGASLRLRSCIFLVGGVLPLRNFRALGAFLLLKLRVSRIINFTFLWMIGNWRWWGFGIDSTVMGTSISKNEGKSTSYT